MDYHNIQTENDMGYAFTRRHPCQTSVVLLKEYQAPTCRPKHTLQAQCQRDLPQMRISHDSDVNILSRYGNCSYEYHSRSGNNIAVST